VTQTSHVALPAHAPETVQVSSKSDSNEGHFTLDAEIFFVPISPRNRVQVWSKLRVKKGHFTLQAEIVIRPYLATQRSGVTRTWHISLCPQAPLPVPVWSKSDSIEVEFTMHEGHTTLEARLVEIRQQQKALYSWRRKFFVPISPRTAAGWGSPTILQKHCKIGRNRAAKEGT
jgi:hypothetical protein